MRAHFDFSGRRRRDSRAEPLERRTLLAVFTVTSALDSGGGTLRDGIEQANAAPGPDTIGFAIGTGAKAIALQSELPAVQDALTIDGATQPGFAGAPLITLNGAAAGASATGLTISAAGSTVRGLVINRFGGDGIVLDGGGASTIAGNYIGTDSAGAAALANGGAGVVIRGGSTGNTIGGTAAADRNIISGNGADGIALSGAGTTGNLIAGNYVGVNRAGAAPLPNRDDGIDVGGGATENTIGGTAAAARNVISGNAGAGIYINGQGTDKNLVQGNYIGTDATGTSALPNAAGVQVEDGSQNVIGGAFAGAGNLISGNRDDGIDLIGASATLVAGNRIGTDAGGTSALGNGAQGVALGFGATGNVVGGSIVAARNLISGNGKAGVLITSLGGEANANRVQGNYVGTNATGSAALPNLFSGVEVQTSDNLIGGTAPGTGNLISGNAQDGVVIGPRADELPSGNLVAGNFIGISAGGASRLGNAGSGIHLHAGADRTTVGGTTAAARNVISGNGGAGVFVQGGDHTLVQGNYVGTNNSGTASIQNGFAGMAIGGGTAATIGGTARGAGNLISGNNGSGINIGGGTDLTIQGNLIGTDVTGKLALPNADNGVWTTVDGTHVGGTEPGEGNRIAFNARAGVLIGGVPDRPAPTADTVLGNSIFSNAQLGIELGFDGPAAPVLTAASEARVSGTLSGAADTSYRVEFFSSREADPSGSGEGEAYLGFITVQTDASGNASFVFAPLVPLTAGRFVTATATGADADTSEFSNALAVGASGAVVGRHVFYNNSSFDGADAGPGEADDQAVAIDKQALRDGQAAPASFANVTSYLKGINGVMVDVRGLPADVQLTADDFSFRTGTVADHSQWTDGPRPMIVEVRRGAGDGAADRVTLIWPDYNPLTDPATMAVANGWLEVTVKASARTGLAEPDVFVFGNLIGETGDAGAFAGFRVNALDLAAVKRSLNAAAPVTAATDFNRDGRTNALDLSTVKRSLNHVLPFPAVAGIAARRADAARRVWLEVGGVAIY